MSDYYYILRTHTWGSKVTRITNAAFNPAAGCTYGKITGLLEGFVDGVKPSLKVYDILRFMPYAELVELREKIGLILEKDAPL